MQHTTEINTSGTLFLFSKETALIFIFIKISGESLKKKKSQPFSLKISRKKNNAEKNMLKDIKIFPF